jgi:hypothetical protein
MLKLTSLALGLLTVLSIAPSSEAMSANINPVSLQQPAANLHSQVILRIGDRKGYSRRGQLQRQRDLELQRRREAERRRRQFRRSGDYRRDR